MPLMALQHVGLQQRVVRNTGDVDTVVGKDMHVVFEMLAELGVLRTLQPGFQLVQHLVA